MSITNLPPKEEILSLIHAAKFNVLTKLVLPFFIQVHRSWRSVVAEPVSSVPSKPCCQG